VVESPESGIASSRGPTHAAVMGDGRSFDQALRALDKFVSEHFSQDAPDQGPPAPLERTPDAEQLS